MSDEPVTVTVTGLRCPHCHEPMPWHGLTRIEVDAALHEVPLVTLTGIAKHRCRKDQP